MALTNTFTATTEITINGETIRRVNNLRIGQRFENHHDFEISVSPDMLANRFIKLRDLADKFVGKATSITLRQGRLGVTEQTQIFSGIVTSVRIVKGQSQSSIFLISGLSPTIQMTAGVTTRTFTEKTLADIIREVLSPFSFATNVSVASSSPIPYITQYEEDNYHFLQRLAEHFGEWVFYDGRSLIFGKTVRATSPTVALIQGKNLFDMEYGLRVTPLNFKASYFNYEAFELFKGDASAEQVDGLSSFSQMTMNRSGEVFNDNLTNINFTNHADEASLKKAVKLMKSEQSNKMAVLTGRTSEMEMKIGGLVTVSEPVEVDGFRIDTIDYGTFVVTRLNHFVDSRGVYEASFEAIPQDSSFAPIDYRIVQPIARPQIALVKDTDDPLKLGRIKVEFWWQRDSHETTPFIRVSSMMTGLSKSYFIPEVNDLVMIDFENGNPDLPFVVSSLYARDGGVREPGDDLFKPDNHIKGIITRGGNHIIIDDTDGKEKIKIFNKENKNEIELSLDGGEHINIRSRGSVNISAGSINLNASNINIKASKNLFSDGKESVIIKTEKEIALSSKSTSIVSSEDMVIGGKTVNIVAETDMSLKAGAKLDLKADASATLKAGAMLDISAGPKATLKAGMVEIN